MFNFELEGGSHSSTYYSDSNEIKFDPPVYEQRYCMAVRILEHDLFKGHIKKVVDFGCAEMKLLELLKRVSHVEHILEVDIDEQLLHTFSMRAKPLVSDYLNRRKAPLRIDIYKGSIDTTTGCLHDVDAVIAIEIIEHLYPGVLNNVPYNIFGFIRPKLAIFTTPNSEYNVLFNLTLPNGFRHDDHKFEWTREQFQDWCYNICDRFPNYQVAFLGAGEPPPGKNIGHVTQIAVFVRNDVRDIALVADSKKVPDVLADKLLYKLLYSEEFPVQRDERNVEERLLDDVKYHIFRHQNMEDRFLNIEQDRYEIPVEDIYELVYPAVMTVEELVEFLTRKGYRLNNSRHLLIEREYDDGSDTDSSISSGFENRGDGIVSSTEPDEVWD